MKASCANKKPKAERSGDGRDALSWVRGPKFFVGPVLERDPGFQLNVRLRDTVELFAKPSFSVIPIDRDNVFAALVVKNVTD